MGLPAHPGDGFAHIDGRQQTFVKQRRGEIDLTIGDGDEVGGDIGRDVLRLGLDDRQRRQRAAAPLAAQMGGPLQQAGVDVEDVARVGLPARRTAQQQRQLAVGPRVPGQVIVDDEHVPAPLHEVLGHGGGGIGRDEAQPRRILVRGHHHNGVVQYLVSAQGIHHPGHGRAALADGAVDADHVLVALVDDGVDRDRGLAGLAVADDQFALAAADGDEGVNGLNAGFQGRGDRRPVDDGGGGALHRPPLAEARWFAVIERPPRGIDDPARQSLPDRRVRFAPGGADLDARGQPVAVAEQHDADLLRLEVDGNAQHAVRETHQLLRADAGQSLDAGDAAAHMQHGAGFTGMQRGCPAPDCPVQRGHGLVEQLLEQGIRPLPLRLRLG